MLTKVVYWRFSETRTILIKLDKQLSSSREGKVKNDELMLSRGYLYVEWEIVPFVGEFACVCTLWSVVLPQSARVNTTVVVYVILLSPHFL